MVARLFADAANVAADAARKVRRVVICVYDNPHESCAKRAGADGTPVEEAVKIYQAKVRT